MIIGLTGCKGSGKNHFYHVVKREFPQLDVRQIAYADPIKKEIMHIFSLVSEDEYDRFKRTLLNFDINGVRKWQDGRHVVREIGMMMRNYDPGQFVAYVEREIKKAPNAVWCVTDVRFDNEIASLKAMDAILLKINRMGYHYDGHITETEIPDRLCTNIIDNKGSLEDYEAAIVNEMKSILATLSIN